MIDGRLMRLFAMAAHPDGTKVVRTDIVGDVDEAEDIGRRAAMTFAGFGSL